METPFTVLVIEDSPVVQHVLRATLAPLGGEMFMAEDGESGLHLARIHRPDVITLDIGLPGMNGWEVLTELRSDADTAGIGVVVLTAHIQESMKQIALERGADGFLGKPFQPEALRASVASLLMSDRTTPLAVGL